MSDQNMIRGTALVVQWLRLRASTAGGMGSIPGQGTKNLHAARHSQNKKQKTKHDSLGGIMRKALPSANRR